MAGKKVTLIGSGNWGSAIARIVGETVKQHDGLFDKIVRMWVFEEMIDGKKLTEIINNTHENVKYLPGYKIPDNVLAVPDVTVATKDADILIFVIPHQFIEGVCKQIKPFVKPGAIGVTLIKGLATTAKGSLKLISEVITESLGIEMAALMGANLAREVAEEHFCESTVGAKNPATGAVLKKLFQSPNFRITAVEDAHTVEICGALKNIVACAAGISDGLGLGDNTKSAIIRLGLMEMTKFVEYFYPGSNLATFFESCGVADLVTTCYGGRNRKCAMAFVTAKVEGKPKTLQELEHELLGGQRLQGPHTAEEVYGMLEAQKVLEKFPLFVAVHKVCSDQIAPAQLIECLRNHPEHQEKQPSRNLKL